MGVRTGPCADESWVIDVADVAPPVHAETTMDGILVADLVVDAAGNQVPPAHVAGIGKEVAEVASLIVRPSLVRRRQIAVLNLQGNRIDAVGGYHIARKRGAIKRILDDDGFGLSQQFG